MFRTIGDQPSLWESRLPAEVLRLPEELARVDALLDDPAFFAPYFHPVIGGNSPQEVAVRSRAAEHAHSQPLILLSPDAWSAGRLPARSARHILDNPPQEKQLTTRQDTRDGLSRLAGSAVRHVSMGVPSTAAIIADLARHLQHLDHPMYTRILGVLVADLRRGD